MSDRFQISRVFRADRGRVWQAWTDPAQFALWFGPRGSTCEVLSFDFRPSGYLHSRLDGADGSVMWGKNFYRSLEPPDRLVWEQSFSNAQGDIVPAPFPMPWPLRMLTTVTFEDEDGGTRVTLTWKPLDATPEEEASFASMMSSMNGGWIGTFDKLETFLAQGG
ncbi:MAG: hypothetical protein QOJ91_2781 [Sphingomonadales bacterium]|jgi:uncharacterized protein YndB with AHSA1/START domain|nr:hypothetical protein [Sphingomonadales bacterium]